MSVDEEFDLDKTPVGLSKYALSRNNLQQGAPDTTLDGVGHVNDSSSASDSYDEDSMEEGTSGSEFVPDKDENNDGSNFTSDEETSECFDVLRKKRKTAGATSIECTKKTAKKPKRPCVYCGKLQAQLSRHLKTIHASQEKVKEATSLKGRAQIRKLALLRKEGMLKYNMSLLKENNKDLITERKHKKSGKGHKICQKCHGFYVKTYFHRHVKECQKEFDVGYIEGFDIELLDKNSSKGYKILLSKFRDDEIGRFCKTDPTMTVYGEYLYQKHSKKKDKQIEGRRNAAAKMRTMGKLYHEFVKCAKNTNLKLEDMFDRTYFPHLQTAINTMTTRDDGDMKPGLKIFIGNTIKNFAFVLKGDYLTKAKDDKSDEIDKFITVLKHHWNFIFGEAEYENCIKRQTSLRQPANLPLEDSVAKLRKYTVDKLTELLHHRNYEFVGPQDFIAIRDLVVSRLTLFNARRGGEPSRLLITDWIDAKEGKWIDQERAKHIQDSEELALLQTFKVIYQGGKGNHRLVPVLVPPDCVDGLDFLQNPAVRKQCNVHPNNTFLFPSTKKSLDHASGWHCVKNVSTDAKVEHITATQMRHRVATLYATLDVPENERTAFYEHMGHSKDINKNIYQCPPGNRALTVVGKHLISMDGSQVTETSSSGQQPNSESVRIESTSGVSPDSSRGAHCSSQLNKASNPDFTANPGSGPDLNIENSPKSDLLLGQRHKWLKSETEAVCSEFASYIKADGSSNTGRLPGSKVVKEFLSQQRILQGYNDDKRIHLVKMKVFNEKKKFRENFRKKLDELLR